MASLDDMFRDMFTRMNVGQTGELVERHTEVKVVPVPMPPALARMLTPAAGTGDDRQTTKVASSTK
jgi:hypothetical protein